MSRAVISDAGSHEIVFRRNDHDRRAPSRVLTALLMGDPAPDRLERVDALRLKAKPPKALVEPSVRR